VLKGYVILWVKFCILIDCKNILLVVFMSNCKELKMALFYFEKPLVTLGMLTTATRGYSAVQ
jgi:hypothetical protein